MSRNERRIVATIPATFFEEHYRETPDGDPFGYANSGFEAAKYRAQLALMAGRTFDTAIELGCSIGVFTELFAPYCNRLLATDCAETAIERARARCARFTNVSFERRTLPEEFPDGKFDAVVFAELGYYLDGPDLERLKERVARALRPHGNLILTHMAVRFEDYMERPIPSTYQDVHGAYTDDPRFELVRRFKGFDRAGTDDFEGSELYWCDLFERV